MAPLERAGARLLTLDPTDDDSLVGAVECIRRETGRIDVLVNNAGYGIYGTLEEMPLAEARRQFEVNLFGTARLCQLVLPIMRSQNSGKIVNVSSIGGKLWEPFGSWYHAAKFALEGLSGCLRVELTPFGVDVIVIEPGPIRTEWNKIAQELLVAISGDGAYGPFARRHATAMGVANQFGSSPEAVAETIAHAIQARRSRPNYVVGGTARLTLLIHRLLSDRLFDRLTWRLSQRADANGRPFTAAQLRDNSGEAVAGGS
jgi:NAD(P)-dependent dehydrogenase (short-subunit alcohol dehydrogenase family)